MSNRSRLLPTMLALLVGTTAPAHAADPAENEAALLNELDRVRAEVANEVQLAAYDLVDELIYGWTTEPPFGVPTPVVLAEVTVPVGLGTGMQALLENHIAAVLLANPKSHIQLVHCPTCTAVVVRSGPDSTVVSRGYDDPSVLAKLGDGTGKHALFIDVEAEGAWLVLRARLTQLTPDLPIVWSHTIATSTSTPALLRQSSDLKSAEDAHDEYLAALHERGPLSIPVRLGVRTYERGRSTGTSPPPFIWLQLGVEMGATDAKAWTSSVVLGYSFVPEGYQGVMGQVRVNRLLTGKTRSLTRPDLYGFVGGAVTGVWGAATTAFREEELTTDELLLDTAGENSRTAFGALHIGADLRMGNRMGLAAFIETLPSLRNSPNLGDYITPAGIGFQSFGTEVTLWF
jgi:hypothetical protein